MSVLKGHTAMELTACEKMIFGMQTENENTLLSKFTVREIKGRGRSVFARKKFKKGEYVIEYKGVCTKFDPNAYLKNSEMYGKNRELSYCLEFWFSGEKYCIDATREYELNISRLINHVRNPNLKLFRPLKINIDEIPRVAMFAVKDIKEGDELFWNYFSTFNPVNCMLDKDNADPATRWIFSYLTKDGRVVIKPPKGKGTNRSGVCCICFKYQKRMSNHIISVHKITNTVERRRLISNGRKLSNSCLNPENINKRINFKCPLCKKDLKYLLTHLNRNHGLSKEARAKIICDERKRYRLEILKEEKK